MTELNHSTATFAGGCFWCTEAVFKRLKGVISVVPGYTGGYEKYPSYEQVITGITGHAEAIQIQFDPSVISYEQLLEVFFLTHNPTTLNRQGNDIGTNYRSAIFYHTDEQKNEAQAAKKLLDQKHTYNNPLVTEITQFSEFYPAEKEHKEYYDTNRNAPYCMIVIDPKIRKFMKNFNDKVKDEFK